MVVVRKISKCVRELYLCVCVWARARYCIHTYVHVYTYAVCVCVCVCNIYRICSVFSVVANKASVGGCIVRVKVSVHVRQQYSFQEVRIDPLGLRTAYQRGTPSPGMQAERAAQLIPTYYPPD